MKLSCIRDSWVRECSNVIIYVTNHQRNTLRPYKRDQTHLAARGPSLGPFEDWFILLLEEGTKSRRTRRYLCPASYLDRDPVMFRLHDAFV